MNFRKSHKALSMLPVGCSFAHAQESVDRTEELRDISTGTYYCYMADQDIKGDQ